MQLLSANIAESNNPGCRQPEKTAPSGDAEKFRHRQWFFTPVLAPLLLNRLLIGIFLGIAVTQLILVAGGLNGWQCPIRSTFGAPCPGCGLTTAMALLIRGQWAAAVGMHAFAPFFIVVLAAMAAAVLLPAGYRRKLSAAVSLLERKTAITAIITLGMLLYWLLRVFLTNGNTAFQG